MARTYVVKYCVNAVTDGWPDANRTGAPSTHSQTPQHRSGRSEAGWDGGEPEDQLLVRDWQWVPGALQAAYDAGVADAKGGAR